MAQGHKMERNERTVLFFRGSVSGTAVHQVRQKGRVTYSVTREPFIPKLNRFVDSLLIMNALLVVHQRRKGEETRLEGFPGWKGNWRSVPPILIVLNTPPRWTCSLASTGISKPKVHGQRMHRKQSAEQRTFSLRQILFW